MLEVGIKALLSYLLGAVIGGLVVGYFRGGVDIRKLGSGNAGGTNALRTQGFGFAAWVMIIDVGKGLLAVLLLPSLALPGIGIDESVQRDWLTIACAFAVVVGHVYPVWFGFRGGKGAATLIGVVAGIQPWALIPVLLIWLLVVVLSGFVGLGTITAAIAFPLYIYLMVSPLPLAQFVFGIAMLGFVCFTHRANISRMLAGTENRARRLWLLGPR